MTFTDYVLHQLREMKRELLFAIEDVAPEDLFSFEPMNHWPVGWIAEHCTEVADKLLHKSVTGDYMHDYHEQVANWTQREPVPGDPYPTSDEIARRWADLCDWVVARVETGGTDALDASAGKVAYVQNVLLAVNHTNSHLRSLWCILGERRVDHKWEEQKNYLA
jgi:hypothetical protein